MDQWKAWEQATGIPVTIIGLPWAEAQRRFNAGEADVLDTVFITEERKKLYSFSEPYARIQVPIFIHNTISGIASIDDLRGFRIAVKEGDAAVSELAAHGISDIALHQSYEAIVEAAVNLDARIFCIDAPPAYYYLYKRGLANNFRIAFVLNEGAFHRAVLKGNEELLVLVERGFASVPPRSIAAIDRKWLGSELSQRLDLRIVGVIVAIVLLLILFLVATAWELRRRIDRATNDLHEQVILLETSEAKNQAFIAVLPDIVFTLDKTGVFLDTSTTAKEVLPFPHDSFLGKHIDEVGFPKEVADGFMSKLKEAIDGPGITNYEFKLEGNPGLFSFEGRFVPLTKDQAICVVRDITFPKRQENLLRVSLLEKEILLKEIHHRVKNNMQVISSLIQLQSYSIHDDRDRILLQETQFRINAMATIHELLYQSPDLSSIDAGEYLGSIIEQLSLGFDSTGIRYESEPIKLGLDAAVPLGLIANELLINAIKHAYMPTEHGPIYVSFHLDGPESILSIWDEGRGLPMDVDPLSCDSMGFTLVRNLAIQLKARLSYSGPPGFKAELRISTHGLSLTG